MKVWVIDGEEEARLSAQGVLLGWPGAYGLVSDIGGSSMELAELAEASGKKSEAVETQIDAALADSLKGVINTYPVGYFQRLLERIFL